MKRAIYVPKLLILGKNEISKSFKKTIFVEIYSLSMSLTDYGKFNICLVFHSMIVHKKSEKFGAI